MIRCDYVRGQPNVGNTDKISNNAVPIKDARNNSLHHSRLQENNAGKPYKPPISIVMPVYKLSKLVTYSIRAVERTLDTAGYSYEIVVVDDGSPDATADAGLTRGVPRRSVKSSA